MGALLAEALAALAAAGGGAVVQAAGTDAWQGVRQRVAALFGGGDAERGRAELERLDRTARALEPGAATDPDRELSRQEGVWQERFEALLESVDPEDRERVVQDLRALLAFVAGTGEDTALATGNALARDGGSAVTGVKRSGGRRPARAVNTGDAEAAGAGSSAVSGIVTE
ncbi:hypothetical protein IHE55_24100 [Streptomyces pactum]|uniref:Uncharacterized protein n=1 Tax=Streptomyces pactum TaxID=68249 RepID=A0ABS0NR72_9ACTN|nr:hypothetical protein [Streptomyces pactum]MBH5337686.1 hypothetical protein [Streptomyces pactum]